MGCVKACLRKSLGTARLTFDELLTVLVEVEGSLNSRPLTYMYDEVKEEVLTASHLTFGRRIKSLPDLDTQEGEINESECNRRFRHPVIR